MKRKILFRGKCDDNTCADYGKWVYGFYTYHLVDHLYIARIERSNGKRFAHPVDYISVNNRTVGQFTGHYDLTKKEIFEGDIVRLAGEDEDNYYTVEWDEQTARFIFSGDGIYDFDNFYDDDIEIIGNIYDRPELVNGTKQNVGG